jgi:hypothetical protein
MKKIFLTLALGLLVSASFSQEQDTTPEESALNFGVDLYSRYVWRGLEFSDAPNIQPWASVTWKGLTLMAWGSYATSKNYAEVDFFLSYAWNGLTVGVNDYFNPVIDTVFNDYSIWTDSTTPHLVEAFVSYQLPFENFPLLLTASTFIYGADRNAENKSNYSTYLEAAYPFTSGKNEISLFAGATLGEGYYASDASFVNVGAKISRNITVTDKFEIPINGQLIFHPKNRNVFFVVGVSF